MSIIIGDIHGNIDKVRAFLGYKPEVRHVALGDYLDSFFESQERQIEALQLLMDSSAVLLWGNHDLHYLSMPPFRCAGFQQGKELLLRRVIEENKGRFLAAYVADGWLCTHAGVHAQLARDECESAIADRLNQKMREYLALPYDPESYEIFGVARARGGISEFGGIFWFDFKREDGLATSIQQIFGHTETSQPLVTSTYIALDTTNCDDTCYLFDTETNKIVNLKLPLRRIRGGIDWGDEVLK